jgi:sirohydrochlorin ferrochelatase
VVLLGHGSPDERHSAGVARLAQQVADLLGEPVVTAYLQHNEPELPEAVARLRAAGWRRVRVLPLLLSRGGHLADDVPVAVAQAQESAGSAAVDLLPPMPPDRLSAAALAAVADGSLGRAEPAAPPRIVLVTAGSERAGALSPFQALAAALTAQGATVEVANGPRADLDRAASALVTASNQPSGRPQASIFAVPVMYAQGLLPELAASRATALGLVPTPVIGDLPECAQALAEWIAEPSF